MNASELNSNSAQAPKQYFCNSLGFELGPISFDDVVKMIRDQGLVGTDSYRATDNSEWLELAGSELFGSFLSGPAAGGPNAARASHSTDQSMGIKDASRSTAAASSLRKRPPVPKSGPRIIGASTPSPTTTASPTTAASRPAQKPSAAAARPTKTVHPTKHAAHIPSGSEAETVEISASDTNPNLPNADQAQSTGATATGTTSTTSGSATAPAATTAAALEQSTQSSPAQTAAPIQTAAPAQTSSEPPAVAPQVESPASASRPQPQPLPKSGGFDLAGIVKNRIVQIAAGVVLAGVLGYFFFPAGNTDEVLREWCNTLKSIEQQHSTLQESEAPTAQWTKFLIDSEKRVEEMVAALSDSANSENPSTQHLLWASRDYLPKMLAECQVQTGPSQKNYQYHVLCADRLLKGMSAEPKPVAKATETQPDGQPVATTQAPATPAAVASTPAAAPIPTTTTLGPGPDPDAVTVGTAAKPAPTIEPYPEGTATGDSE